MRSETEQVSVLQGHGMDLSYSMALAIRGVQPFSILLITKTQTPGVGGSHTAMSAYPTAWLPSLDTLASPLS